MMIILIAAVAKNRVIGNKGKIPWNIPGEKAYFKEVTMGHVLIMGRRTYEEINRPLPGRTTIVVSKTKDFSADGCLMADSLEKALILAKNQDIFIAGGSQLYREALPLADCIVLTEVDLEPEGDTFFPEFDEDEYSKTVIKELTEGIRCRFVKYERKR